jgi:hypothetical protein
MDAKAATKEKDDTATTVHTIEHADSELYKVGMYSTAIGATAVGVWGLVCLSSAILKNGGPVEMLSNLFHSIFGV